jgi:DNA-binding NtrC family response regulator
MSDPRRTGDRPDDESGPSTIRPVVDAEVPRMEHVLIVEDDADIRETLADAIRAEGYDVRVAVDGLDALDKILKTSTPPDCVLLDIGLPYLPGNGVKAAVYTTHLCGLPMIVITCGDVNRVAADFHSSMIFDKSKKDMLDRVLVEIAKAIADWRRRPRDMF